MALLEQSSAEAITHPPGMPGCVGPAAPLIGPAVSTGGVNLLFSPIPVTV